MLYVLLICFYRLYVHVSVESYVLVKNVLSLQISSQKLALPPNVSLCEVDTVYPAWPCSHQTEFEFEHFLSKRPDPGDLLTEACFPYLLWTLCSDRNVRFWHARFQSGGVRSLTATFDSVISFFESVRPLQVHGMSIS